MNEGQLLQETRIPGQTSRAVSESWPRGPGIFLTDPWVCVCATCGSFAGSALGTDLLGMPLPGLSRRTPDDTCLQKFLVSPPGPDISRPLVTPSLRGGAAQDWVEVGGDFSGSSSDHKSGLIAELPPTDARCLPGRLSPGTGDFGKATVAVCHAGTPPWLRAAGA